MGTANIIYTLVFLLHLPLSRCEFDSISWNVFGSDGLNLPRYTQTMVTLNDVTLFYYDSNMKSTPLNPKWVTNTPAQQHWEETILESHVDQSILALALEIAMLEFNLTGTVSDMNVYQAYSHCDLYPDGTIKASLTHAFNGKDFLSLDIDNGRFIASVPQAIKYKRIRDKDTNMLDNLVSFYKKICFDRLRVFLEHAPDVSMKKAPEVKILERQRAGSTILTCHVTGFYPSAVQLKWIGEDLQLVDDEINDVLPNGDGTFQTRRSVIRPEKGDQHYSCVVHHSSLSLEGNITVIWGRDEKPFRLPVWITLSCIFILTVVGLVIRYLVKPPGNYMATQESPSGDLSSSLAH